MNLTEQEKREIAAVFHGTQWLSPERVECIERIVSARLATARIAVDELVAARETKDRADERKAAWDWFGEMLKAHQYEGQPIWDEYKADRRSLLAREDRR